MQIMQICSRSTIWVVITTIILSLLKESTSRMVRLLLVHGLLISVIEIISSMRLIQKAVSLVMVTCHIQRASVTVSFLVMDMLAIV